MEYILGVDLGTSAIKVALFDSKGSTVSVSNAEYQLFTPSTLAVEVEVETYWNSFKKAVADVLQQAAVPPEEIACIGFSAQGETLIPVDKTGTPLRNAIVWMDSRAHDEAAELSNLLEGEDIYGITGQVSIVPTWPASKIAWLRKNEKNIFNKTEKFLLIEDYFIYRLTGKFKAEGSLLSSTLYWDIKSKKYWTPMLNALQISESQLPDIAESGITVGNLKAEVAKELGLSPGTIVCMGVLDQAAGALGVGNNRPGIFSECTGSALAIVATVAIPFKDPLEQMPCHYHGIPGSYMAHTFTTGGMVVKWFSDSFMGDYSAVLAVLDKEASAVPAGSDGLTMLPHLQGAMAPENNSKAKGVFYGLTLHHTRGHFARSILESIGYIIRRNIEAFESMNISVNEIRSLGGGAKSNLWNQIKADITGRHIVIMENEEAACLGAAIVAGTGVGIFHSIDDAIQKTVHIKSRFAPNPDNQDTYTQSYNQYRELYGVLTNLKDFY